MKFKVNQFYLLKIRDHGIGVDAPILRTGGFFLRASRHHYVFTAWLLEDDDKEIVENNNEEFQILKGAVIKRRKCEV